MPYKREFFTKGKLIGSLLYVLSIRFIGCCHLSTSLFPKKKVTKIQIFFCQLSKIHLKSWSLRLKTGEMATVVPSRTESLFVPVRCTYGLVIVDRDFEVK